MELPIWGVALHTQLHRGTYGAPCAELHMEVHMELHMVLHVVLHMEIHTEFHMAESH